ncbi:unnamed protein product [Urochloa humidicola]
MNATCTSSSPAPPLRIVIFPWLAFGHMLPNLELAERLASRGHRVSFISTPGNIARLSTPRSVDMVPLELPHLPGLPDGAENTNDAPDLAILKKAYDGLAAPFEAFLAARCADGGGDGIDCVIVHALHSWGAAAARTHGVPCVMLLPNAPFVAALGCGAQDRTELSAASVFEQLANVDDDRPPAGMPRYEWEWNKRVYGRARCKTVLSPAEESSLTLERCTVAAIRGCPEWDLEDLQLTAALLGKQVLPLGLLPLSCSRTAGVNGQHAAVGWLDEQPVGSVVYVALGSQVSLRVEQVHELALGLELAGTRFLWALRKPSSASDGDILPTGFHERINGRGLVTTRWVPQSTILGHAAVGAFLTHCGESSVIEGLQHGHPLIMLPILADQGPNARLMERKKVGVLVPRDEDDGSFHRHGVASAVQAVMVEQDYRRTFVENARKLQDIVVDKVLQDRYIDEFIHRLGSYTSTGNSTTSYAGSISI